MAATDRHKQVLDRVVVLLQALTIAGIDSDEIYPTDYPFTIQPSRGLAVSMIAESEGVGLNELDTIAYPIQLTLIGHRLHPSDGMSPRSLWRDQVRRTFNRKRIGTWVGGCELVTVSRPATITIPKEWNNWNVDASVMQTITMIREDRTV